VSSRVLQFDCELEEQYMPPRLKTFVTSDGLTDYVVASTSKAKALAAWGIRQDVFKEGRARETDDPELVAAAAERPGEVLRRPASTRGELAKLDVPKPKPAKLAPAKPPAEPERPSKAVLKKVADLERRLADLDAAHEAARAGLARERVALERRSEALEAAYTSRRAKLEASLGAARAELSPPAQA
jgi:hypothetical protein